MEQLINFNKTFTIDEKAVNLAIIKSENINMKNNIEIDDLSINVESNLIPLEVGLNEGIVLDSKLLNISTQNKNILLTNKYKIIDNSKYPLWYKHIIKKPIYAESVEYRKTMIPTGQTIIDIKNLIPIDSNLTIITNSIFLKINNTETTEYYLDTESNKITLASIVEEGISIVHPESYIEYYITENNMDITNNGDVISKDEYKIDLSFMYPENTDDDGDDKYQHILQGIIYNKIAAEEFDLYEIEYQTGNNTINSEMINNSNIFTETTDESVSKTDQYKLTFDDEQNYEITVSNYYYDIHYFIKNQHARNSLIHLNKRHLYPDESWNILVRPDTINIGDDQYDVLELNNYLIKDGKILKKANKRKCNIINSTTIGLLDTNIQSNQYGDYINNITLYNNDKEIDNNLILEINKKEGKIKFKNDISSSNNITASYSYLSDYIEYKELELNPTDLFKSVVGEKIVNSIYIIFMLPLNILNKTYNRSIWHYKIEKYPRAFYGYEKKDINLDDALEYITGTNTDTGYSNLYDIIPAKYFNDSPQRVTIEPFYLGYVSLLNTSVASAAEIIDIRIKGGGLSETMTVDELIEFETDADNNIDLTYTDGKPFPTNNCYLIRIPIVDLMETKERLRKFDKECIKQRQLLEDDEFDSFLTTRGKTLIEDNIKFVLPVEANIVEIVYI